MPTLSYYEEEAEGIDAAAEWADVGSIRSQAAEELLDVLDLIEKGKGNLYDTRSWGKLFLHQSGRCFCFVRHAPNAATEWLYLMFGIWFRDDSRQRREARSGVSTTRS